MAGTSHNASNAFVGRSSELKLLRDELEEVERGRPRLVLIEGPAGIGKTNLARRFLADHPQASVRGAHADEVETNLPYGVLEQLFGELLWPAGHPSMVEPPLAVGARLLDALGELGDIGVLILLVDDAHWADVPSLQALLFTLRRLHADAVLTMLLVREELARRLPPGIERLIASGGGLRIALSGLPPEAIAELLRARGFPPLSAAQLRRLAEHTRGNPLHLTALLEELSEEELQANEPLPAPHSYAALIGERFGGCSPPAHRLVAAAVVLGGRPTLADVCRVGTVTDLYPTLDETVTLGLLERHGVPPAETVSPPHPLTGAAIYQELAPDERTELHVAAAGQVFDEADRLRHRIAAATTGDDALAAEVTQYAQQQARRGAWATAAAALTSASRIPNDREIVEAALLGAAEYWLVAGDLREAAHLVKASSRFPPSARRSYVEGWLGLASGRFDEAERTLSEAWQATTESEQADLRSHIAHQLSQLCLIFGRGRESAEWARRAMEAASTVTLYGDPESTLAMALTIAGESREAIEVLRRAGTAPLTAEQVEATGARGIIRLYVDDLSGAHADLTAVLEASRRLGSFHLALNARGHLAAVEYRSGNWEDALLHGELGVSAVLDTDQLWLAACLHSDATYVPARRGEWARASGHVEAALQGAAQIGDLASRGYSASAAALLAHSRRDYPEVLAATDDLVPLAQANGISEPGIHQWRELRTEALVRLGRLPEAEAELSPYEELAAERGRHSSQAAAGRVRGLLEAAHGRNERATAAFEDALGHARAVPMPFERALVELFYGAFLRRAGQRKAAASQLAAAHDTFGSLAARPYLELADRELAGCGQVRARRATPEAHQLTHYESAVARLVVEGLTNREVAAELIVSVKTVEYHLSAIYRKLGLRSRAQLAAHMRAELVGKH